MSKVTRARAISAKRYAEQRAAERRRRAMVASLVAVAVLVVSGIIGGAVWYAQRTTHVDIPANANATASGVTVGKADAPVAVEVYLDYQCPHCKEFEDEAGATLDRLVAAGTVRLTYHPVAILDGYSTTDYSTRASAASGCAAEAGIFPEFTAALYADQPAEGSAGLTNAKLADLGGDAGPEFRKCVTDQKYADWSGALTDTASRKGVNGTPTVLVDGKKLAEPSVAALTAAVDAAK